MQITQLRLVNRTLTLQCINLLLSTVGRIVQIILGLFFDLLFLLVQALYGLF